MVMRFDGGNTSSTRNTRNTAPRTSSKSIISNVAPKTSSFGPYSSGYAARTSPTTPKITSNIAPKPAPSYSGPPSTGAGGLAARTASPADIVGGTDVGFGSSYGGVTGDAGVPGAEVGAPVVAAPPKISDEDWLKQGGDSIYAEQLAALKKAMEDYQTEQGVQRGRYNTDFEEGSRRLGWKDRDGFEGKEDPGQWDFEDTNFAAGRGFKGQRDDFAARGLLQSSDYGDARTMLERNLNDQRASMLTDRSRFTDDLAAQLAAFQAENTNAQGSARQEALLRRASGLLAK